MNEYNAIAGVYDKINSGVDYEKWATFTESLFDKYLTERPELVLDLASGTGRMTVALARRGYDMIGVDRSPEMLSAASDAVFDAIIDGILPEEGKRPLFLCQSMTDFELYGTVGAIVCCLDSLNYLTGDGELDKCFSLAHNYLDPDGLFIFDMNTPYKFESIYGENAYVYDVDGEKGGSFCVWQNFYDKKTRLCDFLLTVFEENEDGRYSRYDEDQRERCYTMEEIKASLSKAGFELLEVVADTDSTPITDSTERWHFTARAIK
jgi:SAM-dependent methyltransferase